MIEKDRLSLHNPPFSRVVMKYHVYAPLTASRQIRVLYSSKSIFLLIIQFIYISDTHTFISLLEFVFHQHPVANTTNEQSCCTHGPDSKR